MGALSAEKEYRGEVVDVHAPAAVDLEASCILRAKLVPSLFVTAGDYAPRCSLILSLEQQSTPDEATGGEAQCMELASCRVMLCCRGQRRGVVQWLGRAGNKPVHESVRGLRCVTLGASQSQERCTVSEALLGLSATVLQRFEVSSLELEAMDNGSGRLEEYYQRFGFEVTSRKARCRGLCQGPQETFAKMEASTVCVAAKSPDSWRQSLAFDMDLLWLRNEMARLWMQQPDLPLWQLRMSWPHRAELQVALAKHRKQLSIEVSVQSEERTELGLAKAMLSVKEQRLIICWIGGRAGQSIHSSLRGRFRYPTDSPGWEGSPQPAAASEQGLVTCGMALFGFLAELALWFGVTLVELKPPLDRSGKLVAFLTMLGFSSDQTCDGTLQMPCSLLAQRCCPTKLRARLRKQPELSKVFGAFLTGPSPARAAHDATPPADASNPAVLEAATREQDVPASSSRPSSRRLAARPLESPGPMADGARREHSISQREQAACTLEDAAIATVGRPSLRRQPARQLNDEAVVSRPPSRTSSRGSRRPALLPSLSQVALSCGDKSVDTIAVLSVRGAKADSQGAGALHSSGAKPPLSTESSTKIAAPPLALKKRLPREQSEPTLAERSPIRPACTSLYAFAWGPMRRRRAASLAAF